MRKFFLTLVAFALLLLTVVPPQPSKADPALLSRTGNPLTGATAPYLVLQGLTGQSACTLTINTTGGSFAVEGHYPGAAAWTTAITTTLVTDLTTTQSSMTAVGSYTFNCASMDSVRVDGTSASGTPNVTITASNGISKVGRSGGGGGSSSVQAGTGIAVATPSPGVFVVSNTGVTSVTGSGNIQVTSGPTPTVSITAAPTFSGPVTGSNSTAFSAPNGFYVAGTAGASNDNMGLAIGADYGTYTYLSDCQAGGPSSCTLGDVYGSAIFYSSALHTYLVMDQNGNEAIAGYLEVGNLGSSVGQCVQIGTNGKLAGAGSACGAGSYTKAEIFLPLGFYAGTVSTSNVYPYFQVPAYSSGVVKYLRAACGTADNGTTVFTVTDVTASTTIGTVAMSAATTTTTTLGTPYALTTGHVITMTVTTAGTATNCGVIADGTQNLQ